MSFRNSTKLQRTFGSIRSKFLIFFIIIMFFVIAFASSLTYKKIQGIVTRTNERNARSEIKQISTNLDSIYNNLLRQMDAITRSPYMGTIVNYDLSSDLDLVYAIKKYYTSVRDMTYNFPYIHSVYIFLKNNYVLCATGENMQRFMEVDMDLYGLVRERIIGRVFDDMDPNLNFVGGITPGDYPFLFNIKKPDEGIDNRLISAAKKLKNYTIVINIYEEEFQLAYTGISDKPSYFVRILDLNGNIVSSKNTNELGNLYENHSIITSLDKGLYTDDRSQSQIIWGSFPKNGLIITSDVLLKEYSSDLSEISKTLLYIIIPGFVIACILFYIWLGRMFKPFILLKHSMYRAGLGYCDELLSVKGHDELSVLVTNYNEMIQNIRLLKDINAVVEREKREGELKALRNQINPHFLFNTLSSIKWMALAEGNHNVSDCITMLSGIISPMFKSNNPTCTLDEELETVDLYINIVNMGLDECIVYEKEVDEDLLDKEVLRFILQPVIENSIIHGIGKSDRPGVITLKVAAENDLMIISVTDNGYGMDGADIAKINGIMSENMTTEGIGLMNTNRRLKLHYGNKYGVVVKGGKDRGLCVTMTLPLSL